MEEYKPITNLPYCERKEVYTNARIKEYPHIIEEQVCTHAIFPMGVGDIKPARPYTVPPPGEAKNPMRSAEESRRRARSKVMDIARCNKFSYMGTLTIDASKMDRYDATAIYRKVRAFLGNAVARHKFEYVLIPEHHKKRPGETHAAIHMHMLCNLGSLKIVRATNAKTGDPLCDGAGRPVYNLPAWSWGYSTVVPLDGNTDAATAYVAKYIAKGDNKIFGKYYLSSRGLTKSPKIIPLEPINYSEFRDEGKLATGQQVECNLYNETFLLTEVLDLPGE